MYDSHVLCWRSRTKACMESFLLLMEFPGTFWEACRESVSTSLALHSVTFGETGTAARNRSVE
jgi:hypothetical protein